MALIRSKQYTYYIKLWIQNQVKKWVSGPHVSTSPNKLKDLVPKSWAQFDPIHTQNGPHKIRASKPPLKREIESFGRKITSKMSPQLKPYDPYAMLQQFATIDTKLELKQSSIAQEIELRNWNCEQKFGTYHNITSVKGPPQI